MVLDGIKNLYVLYSRLCGGMHLTHMLRMCPIFRAHPHDDYIKKIILLYESNIFKTSDQLITAHVKPHEHVGDIYKLESKESLLNSNHINLLQGHIPCFHKALSRNILRDLGPYAGIVIELPSKTDSVVYKRIQKFKDNLKAPSNYHLPFMIESDANSFKLDHHNAISISSDEFFTANGSEYIREIVKEKFNLTLPQQADTLHDIWFSRVEANV